MIADLAARPPDPLLKIIKMFRDDPRADKIDLGVGVYRDATGNDAGDGGGEGSRAPLARDADRQRPMSASKAMWNFCACSANSRLATMARDLVSIQAVGGTGALRLGCDLLRETGRQARAAAAPSWPNHPAIVARGAA